MRYFSQSFAQKIMPFWMAGVLCVGMAITLPLVSHAESLMPACHHQHGFITTSGQGEVTVKPDALRFTVSVQATDKKLDDTRESINQRMNQVIRALKATQTPNLKLTTQHLNLHPVYSAYEKNKLREKIGYQGRYALQVQVTDVPQDQLGQWGSTLLDKALDAGAEDSGSMQFYVSDLTAARRDALKQAVEDARYNASTMAQAAGVELGSVFSMDGSPQYGGGRLYPVPMMRAMSMESAKADAVAVPIEAGEVTVSSTVSIKFKAQ